MKRANQCVITPVDGLFDESPDAFDNQNESGARTSDYLACDAADTK